MMVTSEKKNCEKCANHPRANASFIFIPSLRFQSSSFFKIQTESKVKSEVEQKRKQTKEDRFTQSKPIEAEETRFAYIKC